jgi:integrase
MPKRATGLTKKGDVWQIDKQVRGYGRLCESTGTGSLEEAERYLARRLEQIRQQSVYGVRQKRIFREAATKYLLGNQHKDSIATDAIHLKQLDKWIGDLPLDQIHDGTLAEFIKHRIEEGRKRKTVNLALQVVRRICNLAARSWRDEFGKTWLDAAPLITMLDTKDSRPPYPLSWEEQTHLLKHLEPHLQRMVLFKVNSGNREDEVCQLRWDWEVEVPELGTSVFIIPKSIVKNDEDRIVVLNRVAKSVIEECRGQHPKRVFTWKRGPKGKALPTGSMNNTAWQKGRQAAVDSYKEVFGYPAPEGFRTLHVHDLKHTFGRRLRAAGVPLETRKVLLGHKNGDITTHYSAPELLELIEAANRVCVDKSRKSPELTVLKRKAG